MATKVIFDGDVELTGSLSKTAAFTASVPLVKFINTNLTVRIDNGWPYILSYNGSDTHPQTGEVWHTWHYTDGTEREMATITINVAGIGDTASSMFVTSTKRPVPSTLHLTITGEMAEPDPITYSATQNGGSIYDNLVELYNSVTGEDPKGHNPSEVIDELKGKIGGGSSSSLLELVFTYDYDGNITCNKTIDEIFVEQYSKPLSFVKIVNVDEDGEESWYYAPVLGYYADSTPIVKICLSSNFEGTSEFPDGLGCVLLIGKVNSGHDSWSEAYRIITLKGKSS